MLDNARMYNTELQQMFAKVWYDEKYMYYFNNWHRLFNASEDDWEQMCFVSKDRDGNVLGSISYSIDRVGSYAHNLGAINFSDNNYIFAKDLMQVIDDIFCKFNFQRLEFYVVCGNTVESTYDRLVHKFGGRIVGVRKRSTKLIDNNYYDEKLYEILREDYLQHRRTNKFKN